MNFGATTTKTRFKFGAEIGKTPLNFGAKLCFNHCITGLKFMGKIYFRRKIDEQLDKWLKSEGHSPALVYGIRQCGKSESIKQFAKNNFKHVNIIDFWKKIGTFS